MDEAAGNGEGHGEEQITISVKQQGTNCTPASLPSVSDLTFGLNVHSLREPGQGGAELQFRIKMKTRMAKVMDAFCKKQNLEVQSDSHGNSLYPLRFLSPEGKRISRDDTALDLELEDGDQ